MDPFELVRKGICLDAIILFHFLFTDLLVFLFFFLLLTFFFFLIFWDFVCGWMDIMKFVVSVQSFLLI